MWPYPIVFATLGVVTIAQHVTYSGNGLALSVNIPSNTASSGSGPIYMQLAATSGITWFGVGQGSSMSGSNMMIMYAASTSNVTVSPRLGTGHVEPQYNPSSRITILEGTGLAADGSMVANIRCDNCLSWTGGSMSPKDSQSSWIWAYATGGSLDSMSLSASISMHSNQGSFTLDLTKGTGGSTSNPFISGSGSGSTTSTNGVSNPFATTNPGTPSTSGGGDDEDNDGGDGDSSAGTTTGGNGIVSSTGNVSSGNPDVVRIVHAATMSSVFVLCFPLAALTIYLPLANKIRYIHGPLQALNIIILCVGLATGVILGRSLGKLNQAHQLIGYGTAAILILFQPSLGLRQHIYYCRTGRKSLWGISHRWLGRTFFIIGIIDGGLGLKQSEWAGNLYAPRYGIYAYSITAIAAFIIYLTLLVVMNMRASSGKIEDKQRGFTGYTLNSAILLPVKDYQPRGFPVGNFDRPNAMRWG